MPEVSRSLEMVCPAKAVWATIADFQAVVRYSPMVDRCELEGPDGVGQLRHLTLRDGTVTVSRMSGLDPETMTMSYQILETKLPLKDYSASMKVDPLGKGRCRVTWTSHFEPDGATLEEASEFLLTQLGEGLEELRKLHGG